MLMMSPRQWRQKLIPLTWLESALVFPQRAGDDATHLRQVFPSVMKRKLSIQYENQATLCKQYLHTNNKYLQPTRRGVVNPSMLQARLNCIVFDR